MNQKSLYSTHWESSNVLQDGRLVDIGNGHGPSAHDLLTLWRRRTHRTWFARATASFFLGGACVALLAFLLSQVFKHGAPVDDFSRLLSEYGSLVTSVATVFLTTGLLVATWRYARLTEAMLNEMRLARQHEGEPQVNLYVLPWLQAKQDPEIVHDYVTKVVVRNVGRVPALDPSLHYDFVMWEGNKHTSGAMTVGPDGSPSTLLPGSETILLWGCERQAINDWKQRQNTEEPFVVFRFLFRDSWNRLCSVTQDYALEIVDEHIFRLTMQFEFVATPTKPRWRQTRD